MNPKVLATLNRWQRMAWLCAIVGLVLCAVGACFWRTQAGRSYWFAWVFVSGLPFGAVTMLMMGHVAPGAWAAAVQRPAEAAAMTLPFAALLLIPVLLVMPDVFPWANRAFFAAHKWPHKGEYLTTTWFFIRSAISFGVLIFLARLLRRGPVRTALQDESGRFNRLAVVSGPGLVIYVFCMNFSSTDWVMSIEPNWYSTMFAVIIMVTQFLSALAFSIVLITLLATHQPLPSELSPKQLNDLGNLLMAFVIFWAYISFEQFLIIWAGNLPREISWYVHRRDGGWQYLALFLALFQFAVPLALLLSRAAKQHARRLRPIASLVAGVIIINYFWLIAPSYHPEGIQVHWLDAAALVGLGGAWMVLFLHFLKQRPLTIPSTMEVSHA